MQPAPSFWGNLVCEAFWSFEFLSFGIVSNFVLQYSNFRLMSNHALPPFRGLPHTTGSTGGGWLPYMKMGVFILIDQLDSKRIRFPCWLWSIMKQCWVWGQKMNQLDLLWENRQACCKGFTISLVLITSMSLQIKVIKNCSWKRLRRSIADECCIWCKYCSWSFTSTKRVLPRARKMLLIVDSKWCPLIFSGMRSANFAVCPFGGIEKTSEGRRH